MNTTVDSTQSSQYVSVVPTLSLDSTRRARVALAPSRAPRARARPRGAHPATGTVRNREPMEEAVGVAIFLESPHTSSLGSHLREILTLAGSRDSRHSTPHPQKSEVKYTLWCYILVFQNSRRRPTSHTTSTTNPGAQRARPDGYQIICACGGPSGPGARAPWPWRLGLELALAGNYNH